MFNKLNKDQLLLRKGLKYSLLFINDEFMDFFIKIYFY